MRQYQVLVVLGTIKVSQPQGNSYHYQVIPSQFNQPTLEYQTDDLPRFIERLQQLKSQEGEGEYYEMRMGGRVVTGGVRQVEEEFDP